MKINKKIFSIILILLIAFVAVACDQTTTQPITTSSLQTTETIETTSITTTELTNEYTHIKLFNISKKFYEIGEELDRSTLELRAYYNDETYDSIDSNLLNIRGFSSSSPGEKTLFIAYDKFIVNTKIFILEEFAFPIDLEYYYRAINLRGDSLKVALNNILHDGFDNLLYGEARYILPESDVDPNNPNNIILVYLGISVSSTWDRGLTWNREHVWPQSRLGVGVGYGDDDFPSKATDLHNLKPADPGENASRSNDYFDWFDTSDTYEPRDEVKGDIARIIFYMSTMYFDLTLNDDINTLSSFKTMGILSVLLEWNKLDPVDDFERNRNEVIYSYQGNRNPFIDYPEFAELIWGDLEE